MVPVVTFSLISGILTSLIMADFLLRGGVN
jgi:hypothetical protein